LEKNFPKDMSGGESINYPRFIYDNLFNVLLVILIVEIISGIIIDTFGALREEHNKITESIENKCMICGKNRDTIEREH
jgi:inositol 1,4,5-triphosphate receptor type 1/inositol 1,4,5-triphosphate receptor type 3